MRRTLEFNHGWYFRKGGETAPDIGTMRAVTLPHDWAIEAPPKPRGTGSEGYTDRDGIGWYRKNIAVCRGNGETAELRFDGVHRNCTVYINGEKAATHVYAYTPFAVDMTPYLKDGENTVVVKVDNTDGVLDRWYGGAGIYRGVELVTRGASCILDERVFVRADVAETLDSAAVTVDVPLRSPDGCELVCSLVSPAGDVAAEGKASAESETHVEFNVNSPELWDIDSPALYTLRLTLTRGDETADSIEIPVGFRRIELVPRRGFVINGRTEKLKGVNLHHDGGCVGAAATAEIWERRLRALREIGVNSIRCSHNPPARELPSLCDRLGFLCIDEAFDKWTSCNYAGCFDEHYVDDVSAMVYRDRNHPCVFAWSVGNEVDQQRSPEIESFLSKLTSLVRSLDPTRPVTFALNPAFYCNDPDETRNHWFAIYKKYVDFISANYHEQWYDALFRDDPDLLLIASEMFPYYRGVDGAACSAFTEDNPWLDAEKHPGAMGSFIWPGVDYLGEAPDFPCRGWGSGIVDTCGRPKSYSWYFRARWHDKSHPVAHIEFLDPTDAGYYSIRQWGWPSYTEHYALPPMGNALVRSRIYTNCDEIELYLNNWYLGRRKVNGADRIDMAFHSSPGEITLKGYIGGECVVTRKVRTPGDPAAMTVDVTDYAKSGERVVFADVYIRDAEGTVCSRCDTDIYVDVSGGGELLGVDNGWLPSQFDYKGSVVPAHEGYAFAVIRVFGDERVTLKVRSSCGLEAITTI